MDGVCDVLACITTNAIVTKAVVLLGWSGAERCLHDAFARIGTVARHYCDCDHRGSEADVEEKRSVGEDSDSAKAACQDHREDCVEDCGARDAFNRLLPCWDMEVAIR